MANETVRTHIHFGQLTAKQPNGELLHKLLALAISVFEVTTPEHELPHHAQLSTWGELLRVPDAIIFYATNNSGQPIACFFVVPRTQELIGYELLHIWNACVQPESRGLGLFPALLEKVKAYAIERGQQEITVCTYPATFCKMYRILSQNGWEEVGWPKEDKILMQLKLDQADGNVISLGQHGTVSHA